MPVDRCLSRWILLALALCLSGPGSAWAGEGSVVSRATVTISRGGQPGSPQAVGLPLHWDRQVAGDADVQIDLQVHTSSDAWAIYAARIGPQFVLSVDGIEVHGTGASNRPLFEVFANPQKLTQHAVQIRFHAVDGRWDGLAEVHVGDVASMRSKRAWRDFTEVTLRGIFATVTATLGLLGILVWLRLREPSAFLYGLSEICWTVANVRAMLPSDLLPWPWENYVFQWLPSLASPAFMLLAVQLQTGDPLPHVQKLLRAILWATPVLALTVATGTFDLAYTAAFVVVLGLSLIVTLHGFRGVQWGADWRRGVIPVIALTLLAAGGRDLYVYGFAPFGYGEPSWLRYPWVLLGLVFCWYTVERLRIARQSLQDLLLSLNEQLAARTAELDAAFQRERLAEKERGAVEERQRLTRDLHDGLGNQLTGTLRLAQAGQTTKEEVVQHIQASIDQMKLTVDALQATDGDIASLLGSLRYRLSPRLQACGIDLHWDVAHLPEVADFGVRQAHQLQMALLEIFNNLMQHSGANQAMLNAELLQPTRREMIAITVSDNGVGFDSAADSRAGKGLYSIRHRIESLGGQLTLQSSPQGTRVNLLIPLKSGTEELGGQA